MYPDASKEKVTTVVAHPEMSTLAAGVSCPVNLGEAQHTGAVGRQEEAIEQAPDLASQPCPREK